MPKKCKSKKKKTTMKHAERVDFVLRRRIKAAAQPQARDFVQPTGIGSWLGDAFFPWSLDRAGKALQMARAMGEERYFDEGGEDQPYWAIRRPVTSSLVHSGLGALAGVGVGGLLGAAASPAANNPAPIGIGAAVGGGVGSLAGLIYNIVRRHGQIKDIAQKFDARETKPTGEDYQGSMRRQSVLERLLLPVSGYHRYGMKKVDRALRSETPRSTADREVEQVGNTGTAALNYLFGPFASYPIGIARNFQSNAAT